MQLKNILYENIYEHCNNEKDQLNRNEKNN